MNIEISNQLGLLNDPWTSLELRCRAFQTTVQCLLHEPTRTADGADPWQQEVSWFDMALDAGLCQYMLRLVQETQKQPYLQVQLWKYWSMLFLHLKSPIQDGNPQGLTLLSQRDLHLLLQWQPKSEAGGEVAWQEIESYHASWLRTLTLHWWSPQKTAVLFFHPQRTSRQRFPLYYLALYYSIHPSDAQLRTIGRTMLLHLWQSLGQLQNSSNRSDLVQMDNQLKQEVNTIESSLFTMNVDERESMRGRTPSTAHEIVAERGNSPTNDPVTDIQHFLLLDKDGLDTSGTWTFWQIYLASLVETTSPTVTASPTSTEVEECWWQWEEGLYFIQDVLQAVQGWTAWRELLIESLFRHLFFPLLEHFSIHDHHGKIFGRWWDAYRLVSLYLQLPQSNRLSLSSDESSRGALVELWIDALENWMVGDSSIEWKWLGSLGLLSLALDCTHHKPHQSGWIKVAPRQVRYRFGLLRTLTVGDDIDVSANETCKQSTASTEEVDWNAYDEKRVDLLLQLLNELISQVEPVSSNISAPTSPTQREQLPSVHFALCWWSLQATLTFLYLSLDLPSHLRTRVKPQHLDQWHQLLNRTKQMSLEPRVSSLSSLTSSLFNFLRSKEDLSRIAIQWRWQQSVFSQSCRLRYLLRPTTEIFSADKQVEQVNAKLTSINFSSIENPTTTSNNEISREQKLLAATLRRWMLDVQQQLSPMLNLDANTSENAP